MRLQFVYIAIAILTLLLNIKLTVWLIKDGKNKSEINQANPTEIINFTLPGKLQGDAAPTEILSKDNISRADDTEIL